MGPLSPVVRAMARPLISKINYQNVKKGWSAPPQSGFDKRLRMGFYVGEEGGLRTSWMTDNFFFLNWSSEKCNRLPFLSRISSVLVTT